MTPPSIELSPDLLTAKAAEGSDALQAYIRGSTTTPQTIEARLERARTVTGHLSALSATVRPLVLVANRQVIQGLLQEIRDQLRTTPDDRGVLNRVRDSTYGKLEALRGRIEVSHRELLTIEGRTPGASSTGIQTREFVNDVGLEARQMGRGLTEGVRPTLRNLKQGNPVTQAVLLALGSLGILALWEKIKKVWSGDDEHEGSFAKIRRVLVRAGAVVGSFLLFRWLTGGGTGGGFGHGNGAGPGGVKSGNGGGDVVPPPVVVPPVMVPPVAVPPAEPLQPAPKPKEVVEVEGHVISLPAETIEDVGVGGIVTPKTKPITIVGQVDGKTKEWVVPPEGSLTEADTNGLFAVTRTAERISVTVHKAGEIGFSFEKNQALPTHTLVVRPKPPVGSQFVVRDWAKESASIFAKPPSVHVLVLGPFTTPEGRFDEKKDVIYGYAVDGKEMTEADLVAYLREQKKNGKLEWVLFENQAGSSANPGFVNPVRVTDMLTWELQVPSMSGTSYRPGGRKYELNVIERKDSKDKEKMIDEDKDPDARAGFEMLTVSIGGSNLSETKPSADNHIFKIEAGKFDAPLLTAAEVIAKAKEMKVRDGRKPAICYKAYREPRRDIVRDTEAPGLAALKEASLKEFGVYIVSRQYDSIIELGGHNHDDWREKKVSLPRIDAEQKLAGFNAQGVRLLSQRDARRKKMADGGADKAFLVDGLTAPISAMEVLERTEKLTENAKPKAIRVAPDGYSDRAIDLDPAYKAIREASLNTFGYFLAPKDGHLYEVAIEERERKDRRAIWKPVEADERPDPQEKAPKGFGDFRVSKQPLPAWDVMRANENVAYDYFKKTPPSAQIRVIPGPGTVFGWRGGGTAKFMPIEVKSGGKTFNVIQNFYSSATFVLPGAKTPVDIGACHEFLKKHATESGTTWVRFYSDNLLERNQSSSDCNIDDVMSDVPVSYSYSLQTSDKVSYGGHRYQPHEKKTRAEEVEEKLNIFPVVMLGKDTTPRAKEVAGDPSRNKVFLVPGETEAIDAEEVMRKLGNHPSNDKPKTLRLFYGQLSYDVCGQPWHLIRNLCLAKYGRYAEQDTFLNQISLYERKEGKTYLMRPHYCNEEMQRAEYNDR